MCEILLCVKDRGNILNPDASKYHCMPKQGDVIDVRPDGWAWGAAELGQVIEGNSNGNHNFFRIIKLPNVTVAQASNMLTPEKDTDPLNPSPFLQFRARYLDKSKIPTATMKALLDHWNDDGRAQGFITLSYTAAQINNIVSVRAPIPFAAQAG